MRFSCKSYNKMRSTLLKRGSRMRPYIKCHVLTDSKKSWLKTGEYETDPRLVPSLFRMKTPAYAN